MANSNVIEGTTLPPPTNLNLATVLRIPAVRQVMLLVGVAAAVAVGFAIALWSQSPGYTQLYAGMSASEAADVSDALRAADIDYKLNSKTGDILVPEAALHEARMQLASQGLPQSAGVGMDMMYTNSSFGDSAFVENARYQHALESELARTIASLGAVREARVHLAIPKQTSFVRDRKSTSASVLVHLYRGRTLEADQAAAVVNLVASSIPDLQPRDVTVVDQYGTLLSDGDNLSVGAQATSQLKYVRQLEESYKKNIEELLTPLVGPGRVRAKVVADVDFTFTEEAREIFDPNNTAVRSEQIQEDLQTGEGYAAGGVPGALSNQPPEASGADAPQTASAEDTEMRSSSRSSVRNFEVDRTISHTRPQAGTIRRLSVAVLIDESADGEQESAALTDDALARYTTLVREAVGFSEARGDTVVVLGETFRRVDDAVAAEPPAFWEKPMLRDILKQILGAALILAIAFGVVRPMLKSVVSSSPPAAISGEYLGQGGEYPVTAAGGQFGGAAAQLPSFDEKVAAAKNITGHDPARVAQVVKKWVAADG